MSERPVLRRRRIDPRQTGWERFRRVVLPRYLTQSERTERLVVFVLLVLLALYLLLGPRAADDQSSVPPPAPASTATTVTAPRS
jgi:hypothetical protein